MREGEANLASFPGPVPSSMLESKRSQQSLIKVLYDVHILYIVHVHTQHSMGGHCELPALECV
jgi:hypothetical protein